MSKVDEELVSLFPQLYALVGNAEALKVLRKLMAHSDEKVRVAAVLSAAKYGRDDLLPSIRILASQHAAAQQEACAIALGMLKDATSVPKLEVLAHSGSSFVKLAAWQALYQLGRHQVINNVMAAAKTGDLFAIYMLGDMDESEDFLFELTKSSNINVRINASLALLQHHDPRCLLSICELLILDSRDLAFIKISSQGNGLTAYKAIPSAQQNMKDNPLIEELSLSIREDALSNAVGLSENNFLRLAHTLFENEQNDLMPALVFHLEKLRTPAAIVLLKKHQQKAGAPLVRNYCNLALYRLKEKGPYAEVLQTWIVKQQQTDFIKFRPFVPWEVRDTESDYNLTPEETSRLLIESFEALTQSQDEQSIDVLLDAIQNGNPKNKYALCGLLMRAVL